MNRIRDSRLIMLGGALAATLGACAHPGVRRRPATEGADPASLRTYSVNFTLIRDPEIDRVVRVYHGTPGAKAVRLQISNPGGQVSCQNGNPTNPDAPAAQATAYTIDTRPDQDVTCSLVPGSAAVASIRVDYLYARAVPDPEAAPAPSAAADLVSRAYKDVQNGQYSPETLEVLKSHNLESDFTLFVRPDREPYASTPADHIIEPAGSRGIVPGDLLLIRSVTGGLGATRAKYEKSPIGPDGIAAPPTRPGTKSPATQASQEPVAHDDSYLYPDERPHRLICTMRDGDSAPKIVYRGGEDLLSTREAKGDFRCEINVKKGAPERLQGWFTVSAALYRKDDAQNLLATLVSPNALGQGAGVTDQEKDEQSLDQVRSAAAALLGADTALVERYNKLIAARARKLPAEATMNARELAATEEIFPSWVSILYRPGPHTFWVVPVKRTLPTARGSVDYVEYAFQNGETPYYPQNSNDPVVKAADNLFAPISSLSSAETWDSANQAPWVVAICPEKQAGAVATINDLNNAAHLGALSTRDRIMEALRPFAAPNTSDCQPGWFASHFGGGLAGYEPIYFQRQNRFQFTYARDTARLPGGRVDTVYSPSRIEALYVAPNGAAVSKVFSRADNEERGPNGLLFFQKGRSVGLDPSKSAKLPPEVSLEARTLYPARDAGGVIESFPSLQ